MVVSQKGLKGKLTYGCDGLAERHDAPGAAEEKSTAMEKTGGEAQQLLQPLLPESPVAALLENHLLVGIILPKGIHRNQVRPEDRSRCYHLLRR